MKPVSLFLFIATLVLSFFGCAAEITKRPIAPNLITSDGTSATMQEGATSQGPWKGWILHSPQRLQTGAAAVARVPAKQKRQPASVTEEEAGMPLRHSVFFWLALVVVLAAIFHFIMQSIHEHHKRHF